MLVDNSILHHFLANTLATIFVFRLLLITNMSRTKTLGTIFASIAIGAITFFVTAPKKVVKKRESEVSEAQEENPTDQDSLFI